MRTDVAVEKINEISMTLSDGGLSFGRKIEQSREGGLYVNAMLRAPRSAAAGSVAACCPLHQNQPQGRLSTCKSNGGEGCLPWPQEALLQTPPASNPAVAPCTGNGVED